MKENEQLDVKDLIEKAKASEHGEAYKNLEKGPNFRIGAGARATSPDVFSFFVETLVYLCPTFNRADLDALERRLAILKELQKRGYSLICQDGNCISCERIVPAQKLVEEYKAVKALVNKYL